MTKPGAQEWHSQSFEELSRCQLPAAIKAAIVQNAQQGVAKEQPVTLTGRHWSTEQAVQWTLTCAVQGKKLTTTDAGDQEGVQRFLADIGAFKEDLLLLSQPQQEGNQLLIRVDQPDKPCQVCFKLRGKKKAAYKSFTDNPILYCDLCNKAWHLKCCNPVRREPSKSSPFYCDVCSALISQGHSANPADSIHAGGSEALAGVAACDQVNLSEQRPGSPEKDEPTSPSTPPSASERSDVPRRPGEKGVNTLSPVDEDEQAEDAQSMPSAEPSPGLCGDDTQPPPPADAQLDAATAPPSGQRTQGSNAVDQRTRWGFLYDSDLRQLSGDELIAALRGRVCSILANLRGASPAAGDPQSTPPRDRAQRGDSSPPASDAVATCEGSPISFLHAVGIWTYPPGVSHTEDPKEAAFASDQLVSELILDGEPMPESPLQIARWALAQAASRMGSDDPHAARPSGCNSLAAPPQRRSGGDGEQLRHDDDEAAERRLLLLSTALNATQFIEATRGAQIDAAARDGAVGADAPPAAASELNAEPPLRTSSAPSTSAAARRGLGNDAGSNASSTGVTASHRAGLVPSSSARMQKRGDSAPGGPNPRGEPLDCRATAQTSRVAPEQPAADALTIAGRGSPLHASRVEAGQEAVQSKVDAQRMAASCAPRCSALASEACAGIDDNADAAKPQGASPVSAADAFGTSGPGRARDAVRPAHSDGVSLQRAHSRTRKGPRTAKAADDALHPGPSCRPEGQLVKDLPTSSLLQQSDGPTRQARRKGGSEPVNAQAPQPGNSSATSRRSREERPQRRASGQRGAAVADNVDPSRPPAHALATARPAGHLAPGYLSANIFAEAQTPHDAPGSRASAAAEGRSKRQAATGGEAMHGKKRRKLQSSENAGPASSLQREQQRPDRGNAATHVPALATGGARLCGFGLEAVPEEAEQGNNENGAPELRASRPGAERSQNVHRPLSTPTAAEQGQRQNSVFMRRISAVVASTPVRKAPLSELSPNAGSQLLDTLARSILDAAVTPLTTPGPRAAQSLSQQAHQDDRLEGGSKAALSDERSSGQGAKQPPAATPAADDLAILEMLCPGEFARLKQLKDDSDARAATRAALVAQLQAQRDGLVAMEEQQQHVAEEVSSLQAEVSALEQEMHSLAQRLKHRMHAMRDKQVASTALAGDIAHANDLCHAHEKAIEAEEEVLAQNERVRRECELGITAALKSGLETLFARFSTSAPQPA